MLLDAVPRVIVVFVPVWLNDEPAPSTVNVPVWPATELGDAMVKLPLDVRLDPERTEMLPELATVAMATLIAAKFPVELFWNVSVPVLPRPKVDMPETASVEPLPSTSNVPLPPLVP